MNVAIGVKTDVGRVREGNEDSFLVDEPLFVVADGMGGHLAGDVASSTAVEIISSKSSTASGDDPQTLAELIRSANAAIWEKAAADPELRGMGTTCTLILLDGQTAHIAHVGDSRAYLLRDGRLEQLTEDHTLVARMVKEGRLRAEEAEHHPQRSIITRALGVDAEVDVDLSSLDLRAGDRLLICSDGLSSMIDHAAIEESLLANDDPQEAADDLVARANDAGGEDNVTVVIIEVDGRSRLQTTPRDETAPRAAVGSDAAATTDERDETTTKPRRRWVRPVIALLLVLALLGGGAYFLVQYMRTSYWYVGVNDEELVTIFQGRSEDLFGIDLDDPVQVTDLALTDLPASLRDNVEEGRTADSKDAAQDIVADLRERAQDLEDVKSQKDDADTNSDDDQTDGGTDGTGDAKGNNGKKN